MISLLIIVLLILLIVFLFLRFAQRKKRRAGFRLHDIGTIIDQSIAAYRRHLLPTLILSAICLPLGSSSGYNLSLLGSVFPFLLAPATVGRSDPLLLLSVALRVLGAFGIGKTLLACGIAAGMRAERQGQPATLGVLFPRQRIGALLGLVLLMIIPSVLSTVIGVIGMLFAVLWAVAPIVMLHEELGPWAAVKRSFTIVRAHYSVLLNTLVPLWLIGWLVVGTPLFAGIWVLGVLGMASSSVTTLLLICGWLIGQICVAPITTFGTVCFYLYVQSHAPSQIVSLKSRLAQEQLEPENSIG